MKVCKFDDSSYDVIAFDEILFSDVSNLRRIKNYVDNNTTKIVVATGDTDQFTTYKNISKIQREHKPDANGARSNLIFPFEIHLHI
jgi:glutamate/tyrosine decarboxylase-like PLP-dependent enzyme